MSTSTDRREPVPYEGLATDALILRDRLALDRTILANDRTLLSFIRTGLALFIAGISLLHLPYLSPESNLDSRFYNVVGWLCVGMSVLVVILGGMRYRKFQVLIRAAGNPVDSKL